MAPRKQLEVLASSHPLLVRVVKFPGLHCPSTVAWLTFLATRYRETRFSIFRWLFTAYTLPLAFGKSLCHFTANQDHLQRPLPLFAAGYSPRACPDVGFGLPPKR
jgi:hypothetical protein